MDPVGGCFDGISVGAWVAVATGSGVGPLAGVSVGAAVCLSGDVDLGTVVAAGNGAAVGVVVEVGASAYGAGVLAKQGTRAVSMTRNGARISFRACESYFSSIRGLTD